MTDQHSSKTTTDYSIVHPDEVETKLDDFWEASPEAKR